MSGFWQQCLESFQPEALGGTLYRIVESQKIIATNQLVDDRHEQQLLEELLEKSKPRINQKLEKIATGLDYLLWTPFRYPPLKYGSRFSTRFESSLFYAARKITTVLAEAAYYRFFFWSGMSVPPPSACLDTQHTVFSAKIFTNAGAKLNAAPFEDQQDVLTDKSDYQHSQALGQRLRELGVKAFEYVSARDLQAGLNVALFSPEVFKSKSPESFVQLVCSTCGEEVVFLDERNNKFVFPRNDFLVAGAFPQPAG